MEKANRPSRERATSDHPDLTDPSDLGPPKPDRPPCHGRTPRLHQIATFPNPWNHENEGFDGSPISKSKSYSTKMKQNKSTKLSSFSFDNRYHKKGPKNHNKTEQNTCNACFSKFFWHFLQEYLDRAHDRALDSVIDSATMTVLGHAICSICIRYICLGIHSWP